MDTNRTNRVLMNISSYLPLVYSDVDPLLVFFSPTDADNPLMMRQIEAASGGSYPRSCLQPSLVHPIREQNSNPQEDKLA